MVSSPQIVVGTIVARVPSTTMAASALVELDFALEMFERAKVIPRVKNALVSK